MGRRWRVRGLTRQELALVAVTVVWGGTFVVVGDAMHVGSPFLFVGVRFLTAGIVCAALFSRSLRGLRRRELGAGAAIGVVLFLGYALQSAGQVTVNASNAAFITALYIPLVPLLQWAVYRRPPKAMVVAGVVLAFIGLVLLAGPGPAGLTLGAGEVLILVASVAIAAEVVLISAFSRHVDARRVTVVQLLTAGLLGLVTGPALGEPVPAPSWSWLGAALALGASSFVIQATMNWAQRSIAPTRAAIIYAGEPVWGGVFGAISGERLPPLSLLGAAFIVGGVITSELEPPRRLRR